MQKISRWVSSATATTKTYETREHKIVVHYPYVDTLGDGIDLEVYEKFDLFDFFVDKCLWPMAILVAILFALLVMSVPAFSQTSIPRYNQILAEVYAMMPPPPPEPKKRFFFIPYSNGYTIQNQFDLSEQFIVRPR